jgi:hypothetical protein
MISNKITDASFLMTKEEEDAMKGRDVSQAIEMLKLIHSPKTAPTVEETLKFTHNKYSSNVKEKVDELHIQNKINKLKSYYKSAQSLIADEKSKKAHRSRVERFNSQSLSK